MYLWVLLPCQEIPGVGQVHDYILQDAITECEYHLRHGMAENALLVHYQDELIRLQSTWRGVAASNMLARLRVSGITPLTPLPPHFDAGAGINTLVSPTSPQEEMTLR